jgi:hypothetical protein
MEEWEIPQARAAALKWINEHQANMYSASKRRTESDILDVANAVKSPQYQRIFADSSRRVVDNTVDITHG